MSGKLSQQDEALLSGEGGAFAVWVAVIEPDPRDSRIGGGTSRRTTRWGVLRLLADVTGDGRVDIAGCGGPGVYVVRVLYRRFRTR